MEASRHCQRHNRLVIQILAVEESTIAIATNMVHSICVLCQKVYFKYILMILGTAVFTRRLVQNLSSNTNQLSSFKGILNKFSFNVDK